LFSAVRAKRETRLHLSSARGTPLLLCLALRIDAVVAVGENSFAMVTDPKRGASFHRKKREKKKTYIVINPPERNTKLPAERAVSCLPVYSDRLWLKSADKEKHL
jgi:hypothetical protein